MSRYTWVAGALAATTWASTASADVRIEGGAAVGERGTGAAAAVDVGLGPLLACARVEYGAGVAALGTRDDLTAGFEGTLLLGWRPALGTRAPRGTPRFVLAPSPRAAATPARRARPIAILAGARLGTGGFASERRVAAVAAARWWFAGTSSRARRASSLELGAVYVVDARDHLRLRHASLPGWYARLAYTWHATVAGEVGVTGLAFRDADGALRPEAYARAYFELAFEP